MLILFTITCFLCWFFKTHHSNLPAARYKLFTVFTSTISSFYSWFILRRIAYFNLHFYFAYLASLLRLGCLALVHYNQWFRAVWIVTELNFCEISGDLSENRNVEIACTNHCPARYYRPINSEFSSISTCLMTLYITNEYLSVCARRY